MYLKFCTAFNNNADVSNTLILNMSCICQQKLHGADFANLFLDVRHQFCYFFDLLFLKTIILSCIIYYICTIFSWIQNELQSRLGIKVNLFTRILIDLQLIPDWLHSKFYSRLHTQSGIIMKCQHHAVSQASSTSANRKILSVYHCTCTMIYIHLCCTISMLPRISIDDGCIKIASSQYLHKITQMFGIQYMLQ